MILDTQTLMALGPRMKEITWGHISRDALRSVPTEYKGNFDRLRPWEKSRSLQGPLESTKKKWHSRAFFRDNQP